MSRDAVQVIVSMNTERSSRVDNVPVRLRTSIWTFHHCSETQDAACGPYALLFSVSTGLEAVKLQQLHPDTHASMLDALVTLERLRSLDIP